MNVMTKPETTHARAVVKAGRVVARPAALGTPLCE